jgi:hypothetical protein
VRCRSREANRRTGTSSLAGKQFEQEFVDAVEQVGAGPAEFVAAVDE